MRSSDRKRRVLIEPQVLDVREVCDMKLMANKPLMLG
jgi:hypothetical protein